MAIKCEIEEVKGDISSRQYPYIGKNRENGRIVYITKTNEGVSLGGVGEGYFTTGNVCFDEVNYDLFKGKITLSND